jgi:hypothetical protein
MGKKVNEFLRTIGVVVITVISLLIIFRTLNWQATIIKRMTSSRNVIEGLDDSDIESECDLENTRNIIKELADVRKSNEENNISTRKFFASMELKYYDTYYDSDGIEKYVSDEDEDEEYKKKKLNSLRRICNSHKSHNAAIIERDIYQKIISKSSTSPSSTSPSSTMLW